MIWPNQIYFFGGKTVAQSMKVAYHFVYISVWYKNTCLLH